MKLKSLLKETKKIQNEVVTSHSEYLTIDDKLHDVMGAIDTSLDRVVKKSYDSTSQWKKYEKAKMDYFTKGFDKKYIPAMTNALDEILKTYSEELKKMSQTHIDNLKSEVSKIKTKLK